MLSQWCCSLSYAALRKSNVLMNNLTEVVRFSATLNIIGEVKSICQIIKHFGLLLILCGEIMPRNLILWHTNSTILSSNVLFCLQICKMLVNMVLFMFSSVVLNGDWKMCHYCLRTFMYKLTWYNNSSSLKFKNNMMFLQNMQYHITIGHDKYEKLEYFDRVR